MYSVAQNLCKDSIRLYTLAPASVCLLNEYYRTSQLGSLKCP